MNIPTAYANELLGGYQTVANTTERDNINSERRVFGMMVYVTGTDEFYQLRLVSSPSVSDNLNWILANFSGSNFSEWINSVISATGTPPVLPSVGDRYLVTSGSGAWTGFDNLVVQWNGATWVTTVPSDGMTVRSDSDPGPVYGYLNGSYPSGSWLRQNFVITGTATEVAYFDNNGNITSDSVFTRDWGSMVTTIGMTGPDDVGGEVISAIRVGATTSGDFRNGAFLLHLDQSTNAELSVVGAASDFQGNGYVEMYAADLTTGTQSGIQISPNQIQFQSNSGSTFILPNLDGTSGSAIITDGSGNLTFGTPSSATPSQNYVYYDIATSSTITVPDYQEYFIYGDLTVDGTLDIGTYGKVVIVNGALLTGVSSSIVNMGNIEMYDFATVTEITGPVNYLPKYGNTGLTTSSVYDIRGTFSQTNIDNDFQLINSNIVDIGIGTNSVAGSYWDNGSGVYRMNGIFDNSSTGGTFGVGSGTYDNNTNLLNQIIVQSNKVYMSVDNISNTIENKIVITQSSIDLSYSNPVTSQYNYITIGDNKIKNYIDSAATFSVESGLGNLFSVSDTGTISIGTISSTMSSLFLMLDDNNNLTSNVVYVNQYKTFGVAPPSFSNSGPAANLYSGGELVSGSWNVAADTFHETTDVQLLDSATFSIVKGIYNIYLNVNYTSMSQFGVNAPLWIQTHLKFLTGPYAGDFGCITRGIYLYSDESGAPAHGSQIGFNVSADSTFNVLIYNPSSQSFDNTYADLILTFERIG